MAKVFQMSWLNKKCVMVYDMPDIEEQEAEDGRDQDNDKPDRQQG